MPTGIPIKQRIPDTVAVPVPCQRVPDIPEVCILRQEALLHRIVMPCPQVLAVDVRVVAFSIESILIVILRASEGLVFESIESKLLESKNITIIKVLIFYISQSSY